MRGGFLAQEVAKVATCVNPECPAVVVFDGQSFSVLKAGKNVSGRLDADQAVEFVAKQVRSALYTAETADFGGVSVKLELGDSVFTLVETIADDDSKEICVNSILENGELYARVTVDTGLGYVIVQRSDNSLDGTLHPHLARERRYKLAAYDSHKEAYRIAVAEALPYGALWADVRQAWFRGVAA